jgi:hypothetical protein
VTASVDQVVDLYHRLDVKAVASADDGDGAALGQLPEQGTHLFR